MLNETEVVNGLPLQQWSAIFRPNMPEYAASNFCFTREDHEQVRLVFGNQGPVIDPTGKRQPTYTHAVTLTPALAVEMARLLLKFYAEPSSMKSETSAEV